MDLKNTEEPKNQGTSNYYVNYDAQLVEWSLKLKDFKSKLHEVHQELQAEAQSKLEEFETKYEEASRRIDELKREGLIAKDEIKTRFENAWKELLAAYETVENLIERDH